MDHPKEQRAVATSPRNACPLLRRVADPGCGDGGPFSRHWHVLHRAELFVVLHLFCFSTAHSLINWRLVAGPRTKVCTASCRCSFFKFLLFVPSLLPSHIPAAQGRVLRLHSTHFSLSHTQPELGCASATRERRRIGPTIYRKGSQPLPLQNRAEKKPPSVHVYWLVPSSLSPNVTLFCLLSHGTTTP